MKTFLALLALTISAHAADLTAVQVYPDTVVYSNGQSYTHQWINQTGQTVYVTRIKTTVAGSLDGNLVAWSRRISDRTLLQYIGWQDCNFMGGPNDQTINDSFEPDCIAIQPGDGLLMLGTATASTLTQQELLSMFIWYRTSPTP
jgi:hypothetical protein